MKKPVVFAFVLSALFCTSYASAEKIDCESLVDVGKAIDDISEALDTGVEVDEEFYDSMAELVGSLRIIADQEGNKKLNGALDRLEQAHTDNDRDDFVAALNSTNTVFGGLYNSECE